MRFWILVAVLLGLATLGLAVGPRAVDWNAYRDDIETTATRLSGHEVRIDGPIEVSLLPRPVLTARDVTLTANAADDAKFTLDASQAAVVMEIGPLLAGRVVMRDLRLTRPTLTVGVASGDRLRSWPPPWRSWAAPFLGLDFKAVGITDGRIELKAARPDEGFVLSDLSMDVHIGGTDGPVEAVGLFATKHHRFTMTAAVGRTDNDGISAAKVAISVQNGLDETTDLRFSGRLDLRGADQGLDGRLTVAGPDLQHGLAAIASATGYPSTFVSIATAQPFAVEGRIEADRDGIRTDEFQVRLSEKLGKARVDLRLHPQARLALDAELPTLRLADEAGLVDFLPLDLLSKLRVPPGEIDLRLRELLYRDGVARRVGVRLVAGSDGVTTVERARMQLPGLVDVQFEGGLHAGTIGPRLSGKLSAVGDDLGASLAWLDLIDERGRSGGWRGFSLESDVDISSVEIALNAIDLRLDSARLGGKASLRFSERRRLALDVDIARPNLDLYLADLTATETATGLAARLKDLDADINARLERLIWQGVRIDEGTISLGADGGRLILREIAATSVGDSMLALNGEIDLESHGADLSMSLESEHPIRVLRHLKADLPTTSSRPKPLALTGTINGTFERFALDMKADYDGGEGSIGGEAGWIEEVPWYDLTLNARHPDHQALFGQFGLAPLLPADDADGAFELEGRLRHEAGVPWIASGSAKLGPTSFTGSLGFEAGAFAGPFDAKLSVGTPRKDSLAPLLILSGLRLTGDWTPARWLGRLPSAGLRTAWLDRGEGTLSLVSKGGLVGDDGLSLEATLKDGLLYINKLEASPWQGKLEAEFTLERRDDRPFVAIAVDLDQVEASALAAWLGVKSGISAPLDLDLEASSIGNTPYEMMAGLAGEMSIETGPGEIKGLGVPDLREALMPDTDAGPAARSHTMPFRSIEARAELSRGILTFEDGRLGLVSADGEDVETRIDGIADLLLWIVDLALTADRDQEETGVYRVIGPPGRPVGTIPDGN